jgi:hypothetical protein
MAEALSRNEKRERTLQSKREQGYRIESQDEKHAVISIKGRRRFFSLFPGVDERYQLTFDQDGHSRSQTIA